MSFGQLTVRAKLALTFGMMAALVVLVSVLAISALGDANDSFADYVDGARARAALTEKIRAAVLQRAVAVRNLVLVMKPADVEAERVAMTQAHEEVQTRLRQLNDAIATNPDVTAKARVLVAEINRIESRYGPVAVAIGDAALHGQRDQAIAMIDDQCRPLLKELVTAADTYAGFASNRAAESKQASVQQYSRHRALLIGICLAALAAAVVAACLITRSITRALGAEPGDLSDITRRVAAGDLGTVNGAAAAPQGSVLASMGEMQASLVRLIGQVRTAADSIATGSSQIASGNQDLSSRTEQQAASLQETASSMEQLTATVRQNAESAQQASALANGASDVAHKGSAVVSQVVETMTDISDSSSKIAEITGIIEGIAFQTNILALNAAVEAARAGEQGRGFAVVASEVRSLAQRSSSAAKEIKALIGASVQKIRDGSRFADDAGHTMAEVTMAVARVTDIMGEIAAASSEQSRGIEQVNIAITQMDEVTQQNAALVEEAAAASKSLEDQGHRLTEAVSFFRVGSADSRAYDQPAAHRGAAATAAVSRPVRPGRTPVTQARAPSPRAAMDTAADWTAF